MKNKGTILIIIVGAGFAFATFFREWLVLYGT